MINLMYLVLTAMLALNVSAEVMNAFFTLDNGNRTTMGVVDGQLDATVKGLDKLLEDDSKAKYRVLQPAIKSVRQEATDFNAYVQSVRDQLIDGGGNADGEVNAADFKEGHNGELKYIVAKKNKDVTTRLLVDGGTGEELKKKVLETRERLIDTYTKLVNENQKQFELSDEEAKGLIQSVAAEMPFNIDDAEWQDNPDTEAKSWSEYKFRQMPVAAVLPLLSQMQADLKTAEANMVNSMAKLAGGKAIVFDKFFPVVQADKSYVIGGEKIKAKISVGSYSSTLNPSDMTITVNGKPQRINADGTVDYSITGSGSGPKTLKLGVQVKNPLTGEVTTGTDSWTYEVGSRSVAVSADKMNVFYMGVDNPLTVSASGVSSNDVRVNFTGGITGSGSGSNYIVKGTKPGPAKVTVTAKGKSLGTFDFRVKRIPDPVARLGKKSDGTMGNGEFKAQRGVIPFLDNFDFDAKCQIQGFKLVRVPKRQDAITAVNQGGSFGAEAQRLVRAATPGDTYYFRDIKGRCPGDQAGRNLNSMVFTIR